MRAQVAEVSEPMAIALGFSALILSMAAVVLLGYTLGLSAMFVEQTLLLTAGQMTSGSELQIALVALFGLTLAAGIFSSLALRHQSKGLDP